MKIRHVDFSPDEWLSGAAALKPAERGCYITICALIYSFGGLIVDDPADLAKLCNITRDSWERVRSELLRRKKIYISDGMIGQERCDIELERARNRTKSAQENGRKGGVNSGVSRQKPGAAASENNNIVEADASGDGKLTINYQPPTINQYPPKPPRKRRGYDDTPDFLEFWKAYPEKVGKPAAQRAFATALPKTSLQAILAGLERYKIQKPVDRPWLNPATFLNQERWNDEPAPPPTIAPRLSFQDAKNAVRSTVAAEPHRQRMATFRKSGFWAPLSGPKPGERGCSVPDELLTPAEVDAKHGRGVAA